MPRTVMIVEDEADCAVTLEVALEALPGITAVRVATAEAALEAFDLFTVAAVISDVQLPAMSGIELIGRVHQGHRGVPVVIVSASTDAGVEREALRAGAAAFFAKPFSPAAVCEKVCTLLKESLDV
jgi:DNA-binding response OmpR family regulator